MAVGPEDQGSAAAVMASAPPFGFVLGPLIGAALYMVHNDLPLTASALALVGLFIAVLVLMKDPEPVEPLAETQG